MLQLSLEQLMFPTGPPFCWCHFWLLQLGCGDIAVGGTAHWWTNKLSVTQLRTCCRWDGVTTQSQGLLAEIGVYILLCTFTPRFPPHWREAKQHFLGVTTTNDQRHSSQAISQVVLDRISQARGRQCPWADYGQTWRPLAAGGQGKSQVVSAFPAMVNH